MKRSKIREWLADDAIPLWLEKGVDWEKGGFFEILSLAGESIPESPKRAMVQARQIYSFRIAMELGVATSESVHQVTMHGADFMLNWHSSLSGAFIHSVDRSGSPKDRREDLYSQAFGLFGLANIYSIWRDPRFLERAYELYEFLDLKRRLSEGGFSEVGSSGAIQYESNPHMHLFESALAWMEIDRSPKWRSLADEILELCQRKFIDPETGLLCEHFHSGWAPARECGRFVFEPGHQYEWAWLMMKYQALTGRNMSELTSRLFSMSESHGICPRRRSVYDEVWSDFSVKAPTSRFWPQCERIKAAVRIGGGEGPRSAEEAIVTLFRYFDTPISGMWFDTWNLDETFVEQPAKASSLYHIIGALSEYLE